MLKSDYNFHVDSVRDGAKTKSNFSMNDNLITSAMLNYIGLGVYKNSIERQNAERNKNYAYYTNNTDNLYELESNLPIVETLLEKKNKIRIFTLENSATLRNGELQYAPAYILDISLSLEGKALDDFRSILKRKQDDADTYNIKIIGSLIAGLALIIYLIFYIRKIYTNKIKVKISEMKNDAIERKEKIREDENVK